MPETRLNKLDQEWLLDAAILYAKCPLGWVYEAFPWGEAGGELENEDGPDDWQKDILSDLGDGLITVSEAINIAIASGHGIGKSALVAWIILWAMSTMEDTRGVVTANTDTQLRTKTWPELGKWYRLCAWKSWFHYHATSISSIDPEHEKTWRVDMVPWSENNTEAFAGLHNQGKRIIVVFDEASAIADLIWETTEGALTDKNTEIIWFCAGNPTRNTGRFRECFGRFKHRWLTKQIDSRSVRITNKEQIDKWIQDYGADSDFVRVRVKGEFPRAGSMQFIPSDLVDVARKRQPEASVQDPFVMGVDVARFGDDESVIALRRGRDAVSVKWTILRGVDTMTLAARIVEISNQHKPDAIFVDAGGVGGGVVDRLRMLRQPVIEVQFGGSADKAQDTASGTIIYANKRAEMWGVMKDWLRGGSVPDDPDLAAQLIGIEYGYTTLDGKDAILLEKKKDMKKRGLSSPDRADALALTFAFPVQPSDHTNIFKGGQLHQINFDPLSLNHIQADIGSKHQMNYDSLSLDHVRKG